MKKTADPAPLPGSLSLAHSIKQTQAALDSALRQAGQLAGVTGFALVAWDQVGQAMVQVHHSMHSGVEPIEAPELVSAMVEQHNDHILAEARRHPRT